MKLIPRPVDTLLHLSKERDAKKSGPPLGPRRQRQRPSLGNCWLSNAFSTFHFKTSPSLVPRNKTYTCCVFLNIMIHSRHVHFQSCHTFHPARCCLPTLRKERAKPCNSIQSFDRIPTSMSDGRLDCVLLRLSSVILWRQVAVSARQLGVE